ncbi:MAG: translation initiation factor IF-3 [Candidatus Cloacimonetes bacterium]|nr:translation initiation factor IF-3 [Candidatus Cloacimonadota bacterium]
MRRKSSRRTQQGDSKNRTRTNDYIRASTLRVIGADGAQLGVISKYEALQIAKESGLDLVEVSPNADPPVARIMDYGKYKYQLEKKAKESKKKAHTVIIKEIKLRPKIGQHDLDTKFKHIEEFLTAGNKVKLTMQFRGREIAYTDLGKEILIKLIARLADTDLGVAEGQPKQEGRNMSVTFAPKKSA